MFVDVFVLGARVWASQEYCLRTLQLVSLGRDLLIYGDWFLLFFGDSFHAGHQAQVVYGLCWIIFIIS